MLETIASEPPYPNKKILLEHSPKSVDISQYLVIKVTSIYNMFLSILIH